MTIVKTRARSHCMWAVPALLLVAAGCSDRGPEWAARNQQVIDQGQSHRTDPRVARCNRADDPRAGRAGGRRQDADRHHRARRVGHPRLGSGRAARTAGDAARVRLSGADARRGADRHRARGVRDRRVRWEDGGAHQGSGAVSPARNPANRQGRSKRMEGVRGLFAGAAGPSRAGRTEHCRHEPGVSRSGRDAVTPARRRRKSQRDSVDADHRSRHDEVLPPQHRPVAADLGT